MTTARSGITVGIPTMDRPTALGRCLDALLSGAVHPDEIIVVDQGESGAEQVIGPLQSAGLQVQYIRQPRRGLSAARNAIFLHASHAIVAVTDDDCVPDANWLAALTDAFARAPVPDAVTGRVLALDAGAGRTHAVSLRTETTSADFTSALVVPWRVGTGGNFAARRDVVVSLGGYDERLGAGSAGQAAEDIDLAMRLLRAGCRIRYDPAVVIYHERQSEARRMSTRWSYAHGIGAVAGILGRKRDLFAVRVLAAFSRDLAKRLVRSLRAHDRSGLRQVLLSIRGAFGGVAYGWRVSPSPRRTVQTEGARR